MVTRSFINLALIRGTVIVACVGWIGRGGHPVLLGGVIAIQAFGIVSDYLAREVTR